MLNKLNKVNIFLSVILIRISKVCFYEKKQGEINILLLNDLYSPMEKCLHDIPLKHRSQFRSLAPPHTIFAIPESQRRGLCFSGVGHRFSELPCAPFSVPC